MKMTCDGILAKVVQHETDHLDGKLIDTAPDFILSLKRTLIVAFPASMSAAVSDTFK